MHVFPLLGPLRPRVDDLHVLCVYLQRCGDSYGQRICKGRLGPDHVNRLRQRIRDAALVLPHNDINNGASSLQSLFI